MIDEKYLAQIAKHYEQCWEVAPGPLRLNKGPEHELPDGFCVLRFSPAGRKNLWIYATCGMSLVTDPLPTELHVLSTKENEGLVELLTVIAHYHRTGAFLGDGHTVNFGRPWWPGSQCDRGLISLPYLDGPSLEWLNLSETRIRFLWLIPITPEEVEFKKRFGLESLEEKMETSSFNYLDPFRESLV